MAPLPPPQPILASCIIFKILFLEAGAIDLTEGLFVSVALIWILTVVNCQNVTEQILNWNRQNFTEVPDDIPDDTTKLELGQNFITEIRNYTFQHLTECITLNLSHNLISHLEPKAFSGLSNLEELNLEYNLIMCVGTHVFAQLLKLRRSFPKQ